MNFDENDDEFLTEDKINKLIEEGEILGNEMDEISLINCLKLLSEKKKLNETLRMKYPGVGDMDKYINSEIDLHEEIKVLQRIAAYPNLIGIFIKHEGI